MPARGRRRFQLLSTFRPADLDLPRGLPAAFVCAVHGNPLSAPATMDILNDNSELLAAIELRQEDVLRQLAALQESIEQVLARETQALAGQRHPSHARKAAA
jgi:hypothetical protein